MVVEQGLEQNKCTTNSVSKYWKAYGQEHRIPEK